jgi:2-polyprenyl-6-methoxyphenol hydroxylase-like FAD-dependent oxidoreductase
MSMIRRVLVVGGGVGGLTAANAFAQRGVEVVLIERRPSFNLPGVGLGQPANALRIYDAIGVLDEVLDGGFIYDRMWLFDSGRTMLVEHKFLLGDDRVPPVCALPRSKLHEILLGAAERRGVAVRLGTTIEAIEERSDAVGVRLSDGETSSFDLIAGFDGIRSTTRQYLVGTAFVPKPSGYGAWRIQVPRPADVLGMEFLQGIGSKTGAMPLSDELMYLFHIRPEAPDMWFEQKQLAAALAERLQGYGSFVADVRGKLREDSDVVYSPIELMLMPWPWFRGRVVIGGDAAHTFAPHLTQGAAMAAEDGFVLAREVVEGEGSIEARLMRYSRDRFARCAFVSSFSRQWLDDEQSVRTPQELEEARKEMRLNGSARIAASDRILNMPV